jgi:hypothetical protein
MLHTVVIEDKNGVEFKGVVDSAKRPSEDDLVTIKSYSGKYVSGYIIEIIGGRDDSL